mgnify:CR=1 FL=1
MLAFGRLHDGLHEFLAGQDLTVEHLGRQNGGETVARPKVGASGLFRATAKLPPRSTLCSGPKNTSEYSRYGNDTKPGYALMTPAEILMLEPKPLYIQYQ